MFIEESFRGLKNFDYFTRKREEDGESSEEAVEVMDFSPISESGKVEYNIPTTTNATNNGQSMANEFQAALTFSSLFPNKRHESHLERIGSSHTRLREPRQLYSTASLQHPPKWPIECQVIPDKIHHHNVPPNTPESFYVTKHSEPQPQPVGEEMGIVIYNYQPKLSVDYYSRACVGGSDEFTQFDIDDLTLSFESRFESGNLAKVIKITNVYYELYLRPDMYTDRHAQWFYFRIQNTRKNIVYRFAIVNLNKADSLYRFGLKPLMYSEKNSKINGTGWSRCGENVAYYKNDMTENSSYTLTFNLKFEHGCDTVYLAQCYPYTYSNLQSYLQQIQVDVPKSRLCQQRLLCKSLAGNNVYVLTITTPETQDEDQIVKKPAIVLTARVHPGETPSSYMIKGIIDFLLSNCPQAQELRDRFIFKLIPMLNPDGVIVGNSRCCLLGQDLNRQYRTVLREAFPQIYQTKVLLRRLVDENGVFLYCDIHGHSRKNNVFMYGCENRRINEKKLTEQVFPLMMHKNAADKFSFAHCKFRIQKSKEGTGRIFAWTLGIVNSYTLEISLGGSTLVSRDGTHFSYIDYEDVGRHFCETLLDYSDTGDIKGRIRDKILQKLIASGSSAEEPQNIPISDYSSLSHSDSNEDDEFNSGDEDQGISFSTKTKPALATCTRKQHLKKSKSKRGVNKEWHSPRKPMKLNTARVEAIRIQRKHVKNDDDDSQISEKRPSISLKVLEKQTVDGAIPCSLFENDTEFLSFCKNRPTFSPRKYPFRIPQRNEEDDDDDGADTWTQTEDECDLTDSVLKNEFFLHSTRDSITAKFQSLSLLTPRRRSSPWLTSFSNHDDMGTREHLQTFRTNGKIFPRSGLRQHFNENRGLKICDQKSQFPNVLQIVKPAIVKYQPFQPDQCEPSNSFGKAKIESGCEILRANSKTSQKSLNLDTEKRTDEPLNKLTPLKLKSPSTLNIRSNRKIT